MNKTLHKFYAWSMIFKIVLFTVGTLMAGIFPPPSPRRSALDLANFLNDQALRVGTGDIIGMFEAFSSCRSRPL